MKKLVFIIAVLALMSCEKTLTVDERYQSPEIVMNGIFCDEDDTLDIFVTESRSVFGYDLDYKDDLDVDLLLVKNQALVGGFSRANSVESNRYSFGFGTHYSLTIGDIDTSAVYGFQVQHPTMGLASAETKFPTKVGIESVELKEEIIRNEYGETYNALVAYVAFTDPTGEDNYYQIDGGYLLTGQTVNVYSYDSITGYYSYLPSDTVLFQQHDFPSSYNQVDPLIRPSDADIIIYTENMFQVFSDDIIDGQKYSLRYVVEMSYRSSSTVYDIDTAAGNFIQALINLRSIPKDLYLYYSTLDAFYWNDESPFAEPVQIFSNVDNGVGIVAAYRNAKKMGVIGTYPMSGKIYMTYDEYYDRK